jgi:hypothetical protein
MKQYPLLQIIINYLSPYHYGLMTFVVGIAQQNLGITGSTFLFQKLDIRVSMHIF